MTLVTKEKKQLASRVVNHDLGTHHKSAPDDKKKRGEKLSTNDAAKKILGIIECDMQHKKLSENEKNNRAGQFAEVVDKLIEDRRKR